MSGAANGLVIIRQSAPFIAATLLWAAVSSSGSADLGSPRCVRKWTRGR
ncbi:hypothetical protein H7J11_11345 [Mycobacterium bourgelatii]|nr:hypothetical protein [Mycobacterium bourgelatii]